MDDYDVIVIGTGTAAQVTAARVKRAGRSVAMIDHRPFGGTCALRGCDPKKMLVSGAETVDWAHRMHHRGVVGELRIDWTELIAFKRTFTDSVPKRREESFAKQGIDAFHGMARFSGPDMLLVEGRALKSRNIVIAADARPLSLGFPGADQAITSDAFMELEDLPKRIVMVGGGYIAAEFSHIAARAGAKVTVLQRAERMLTRFDPVSWAGSWRSSRKSASRCRPARPSRQSSASAAASTCALGRKAERSRLTPISWFMPLAAPTPA
jgi:glutathione reductase (NADPH)